MPLKMVDAHTLKSWLDNGEAVVVDVREPAENAAEHIAGTTLLPLASISARTLPSCVGKKLVIHCLKGARGTTACERLLAEDPSLEIYNLEGGISAWTEAGFAVQSSGKKCLPLDRQVQLTIGSMLVLSSLLGYFVNNGFFLLTGAIGMGLTIAGLTGFCGLARILARMPWNQRTH